MIIQGYDGSSWRVPKDLQVYDGSSWRRVVRAWAYDGSAWKEVSAPLLWDVTFENLGFSQGRAKFFFDSNVTKSIQYRWREEANPFSAWLTMGLAPSPDATDIHIVGTPGNSLTFELKPYTAPGAGGDVGGTTSVTGVPS